MSLTLGNSTGIPADQGEMVSPIREAVEGTLCHRSPSAGRPSSGGQGSLSWGLSQSQTGGGRPGGSGGGRLHGA